MAIKFYNKLLYLLLLFSINIGFITIKLCTLFSFLLVKRAKKDLILFPYAQKGSDGYTRRFEEYFPLLQKDNITYTVCDIIPNEELIKKMNGTTSQRYYLYHLTLWKRIFQVLEARHYKAAFIQRGLFPFYYDLKNPYLEVLLRKLCNNITIDFWDAVWLNNPTLVNKTVQHIDKITVVNEYGKNYFNHTTTAKYFFPIGVNTNKYIPKQTHQLSTPISFIYTGLPDNVQQFLQIIKPILIEIQKLHPIKLILITRDDFNIPGLTIECHRFSETTFFKLLYQADIGLYAVEQDNYSRGKMAMKVLDYMATGLPIIATPCGLTPYAKNNENLLFAKNQTEWLVQIKLLIENEYLRRLLGSNAANTIQEKHCLLNTYVIFKNIIYSKCAE